MKDLNVLIEMRRHGKWDYSEDKLTKEGRKDAEKLAQNLPRFEIVLSSTTNRARETAEILGKESLLLEVTEILDEIPGIRHKEEFDPEFALQKAKEVLEFIWNKALGELPKKMLIITSGGLLGAIYYCLQGKIPNTSEDLHLFRPLEGLRFSIKVERIGQTL